jgi:hypothetical protein
MSERGNSTKQVCRSLRVAASTLDAGSRPRRLEVTGPKRSRWEQPPPSRRQLQIYLVASFLVPVCLVVALIFFLVNEDWGWAIAAGGLLAFFTLLRWKQVPEILRALRETSR